MKQGSLDAVQHLTANEMKLRLEPIGWELDVKKGEVCPDDVQQQLSAHEMKLLLKSMRKELDVKGLEVCRMMLVDSMWWTAVAVAVEHLQFDPQNWLQEAADGVKAEVSRLATDS